jgi:hypothetical protein
LSLPTHALHGIHHIRLLCQKRVSQVGRPLNVARHPLNQVWKFYQRLDAWVPRLLCHSVRQRLALQVFVSIHPLLKLDNFKWVSGSGECLSQQWIWIESDRRNQRVQLISRNFWSLFCVRGRRGHHLRFGLLRRGRGTNGR